MSPVRSAIVVTILAGILGAWTLPEMVRRNPSSVASLALGTDDAFATSGLEPRENLVGGGALRWLQPEATFRFDAVGPGPVDVDLVVRDHRTELTIVVNGARVGSLLPGQRHFAAPIRLSGGPMVLGVQTEGFDAPGRRLGTQFVSLRVQPVPGTESGPRGVASRLWLAFLAVLVVSSLCVWASGLNSLCAILPPSLLLVLVLPAGLWRSGWLVESALLLSVAAGLAAASAAFASGSRAARSVLQVAMVMALTVHGVLPPSPLIIQSDVQLHGNKLAEVAAGNLLPTSRTDHAPPFEIPYGFSFYGLLSPFASPDVSNVRAVREGAAFFSALSILGLSLIFGRVSAGLAAASVLLWTFAPVNLRTMGYGNLSNVFAQAVFVLFLVAAGLLSRRRVRAAVMSFLVALSATAHLSSFIILATLLLVSFFVPRDRHSPAFKPLLAGLSAAALYYASFFSMILKQAPRLLEERGGSAGVFDPWRLPGQIVDGAGWPLLALVALALLSGRARDLLICGRSLALAAFLLAIAALVSPVEVRYLLAVIPLLAVVGGSAMAETDFQSFPRQGLTSLVDLPGLRFLSSDLVTLPVAGLLLAAAVVRGASVLLDFVPVSR